MASAGPSYGLEKLTSGRGHAAVVLHGIRQTRDAPAPFAQMIANESGALNVFVYGYNHTRAKWKRSGSGHIAGHSGMPRGFGRITAWADW
jgi:hypothetical protein